MIGFITGSHKLIKKSKIFEQNNCTKSDTVLLLNHKIRNSQKEGTCMKEFTVEELAQFDGKDGRKAYVAVDGKVYDVTGNSHWTNGEHHGTLAGRDLTKAIEASPHGLSVLAKLEQVGTLK